ncbi:hypothetical protein WG66_013287 [Moniliophthora roreri]|nr:hypothetical protein WG66_013287 [Moniliophthora roreri]
MHASLCEPCDILSSPAIDASPFFKLQTSGLVHGGMSIRRISASSTVLTKKRKLDWRLAHYRCPTFLFISNDDRLSGLTVPSYD